MKKMTEEHKEKMRKGRQNLVGREISFATTEISEERREYVSRVPLSYKRAAMRAFSGKSLRAGVNAHCLDCCCWKRVEVARCIVTTCPLWEYRPYRGGRGEVEGKAESPQTDGIA